MRAIGVVILAAGAATRMGAVKQLLPFGGRSLLRHTAEEALASECGPVVVVLGAHAEQLQDELRELPVQVVVNPRWPEGMGTSIRAGMTAVTAAPGGAGLTAVLLTICDQPFFSADLVHRLLAAREESGSPLVASAYGETRGVPALFHHSLFPELLALDGPEGARRVIQAHAAETATVPFPEGAFDLDTPEDYAQLSALRGTGFGSLKDALG
jgi:molybdenum cofactor cytidylyltransferase